MNLNLTRWLFLIVTAAIVVCIILVRRGTAQSGSAQPTWAERLEEKAQLAKSGDATSVRALADEVFNQPIAYGFPSVPPFIADPIKERLSRAEIAYRQGKGQGVHERDIVRMANDFASRLGAADYMKTSERQIRATRLRTLFRNPGFVGEGMTPEGMTVAQQINPTMSPLQAVHLTMALVQLKLLNEDYQMTPEQWEAREYEKALQYWQMHQIAKAMGRQIHREPRLEALSSPKRQEITEAFQHMASGMTPNEGLNLAHQALDTLGIAH